MPHEVLYSADRFMFERKITDSKGPGYEFDNLYPHNEEREIVGTIYES
jgi:hypothetical protein